MSAARTKQEDARDGIPSQRQYRVGEIIKKALVEVFERVEIRDPALSCLLYTSDAADEL